MEPDVPASTVDVPASQRVHNPQFDLADGERLPCRVLIQGSHTYVSPRWYPSIQPAEHGGAARGRAEGRAVGTWDYEQVQIAGWLTVHWDYGACAAR